MTPRGPYIWIDRGSNILAVAHLDTVVEESPFCTIQTGKHVIVHHGSLDDRLGAYIILDLLPTMGIMPDILLTTGEESGNSTAQYFTPPKEYNWMFQFDRAGTDVVLYQYEHDDLVDKLEGCGFTIRDGLFSDISYMDELGISGINFGCGYYDNHCLLSHAFMGDMGKMVQLFQKFWALYKDTRIDAPPEAQMKWGYHRGAYYNGEWGHPPATSYTESELAEYEGFEWSVFEELVEFYIREGHTEDEAEAMAWSTIELERVDKKELTLDPCRYCGYLVNPKDHWTMEKYDMCTYCWEGYRDARRLDRSLHELTQEQFETLEKQEEDYATWEKQKRSVQ